jgi:ribonuclease P protein component
LPLAKKIRSLKTKEIDLTIRTGKTKRADELRAKTLKSAEAGYAIIIKKKVGTAPQRNRIKRLIREAIKIEGLESKKVAIFCDKRPNIDSLDYIRNEIMKLLQDTQN